ncbi:MAG: hypothetical protein LH629_14770 [Ignavibacteria bacterium]|nr:hypothetical protein [Ignavibacteria bacterium]
MVANKIFHKKIEDGNTVQQIGFSDQVTFGDVVRFSTRYRVAKSFEGVILKDFSKATVDGYNALFRLFLSWSAFEQLLKITGAKQSDEEVARLFDSHESQKLCDSIRKYDKNNTLYLFIISQVNNSHKVEIEKHFAGREINSSYLASAIRHIFVHGQLTPHTNNTNPKSLVKICDKMSYFLLQVMNSEFDNIVTRANV